MLLKDSRGRPRENKQQRAFLLLLVILSFVSTAMVVTLMAGNGCSSMLPCVTLHVDYGDGHAHPKALGTASKVCIRSFGLF